MTLREKIGQLNQEKAPSEKEEFEELMESVARDEKDCAELALKAGIDLDMKDRAYLNYLEELVEEGIVSEKLIDDSVRRILRVKFAKGLFENPYRNDVKYDRGEHFALTREIAVESAVLLKNNGVLPFDQKTKIGIIGPFLKDKRTVLGSWTLDGKEEETPSLYEALCERKEKDNFVFAEDIKDISSDIDTVLLALGEVHTNTGEANAVSKLTLSEEQTELIKTVKGMGKKP